MLTFGKGHKQMVGMVSDEGESFEFETPVKPEGNVEDWMNKVDEEMIDTLTIIAKTSVFEYAKTDRIEWIQQYVGMITLLGT